MFCIQGAYDSELYKNTINMQICLDALKIGDVFTRIMTAVIMLISQAFILRR